MSHPVAPSSTGPNEGPDPELADLPAPRRPFRRLTLVSLSATALGALLLIYGISGDLKYAAQGGALTDIGLLDQFKPEVRFQNRWVRGEGDLSAIGGIRYTRPLESDSYRLAPLAKNPNIWVQVRVPTGYENEHFVVPTVFAGRLVPFSALGLRYNALDEAPTVAGWQSGHIPKGAWLLIDGESPKSNRWLFGLSALFLAFCSFSLWALISLLRPIPLTKSVTKSVVPPSVGA